MRSVLPFLFYKIEFSSNPRWFLNPAFKSQNLVFFWLVRLLQFPILFDTNKSSFPIYKYIIRHNDIGFRIYQGMTLKYLQKRDSKNIQNTDVLKMNANLSASCPATRFRL